MSDTDRPGILNRIGRAIWHVPAPVAVQDAPRSESAPLPAPETQAAPQIVAMANVGAQAGKPADTRGMSVAKLDSDAYRVHVVAMRCLDRRSRFMGALSRGLQYRTVDGWKSPTVAGIMVPPEGVELLALFDRPIRSLRTVHASARWQQMWGSLHFDAGNWIRMAIRSNALGRGIGGRPKIAELITINPDRIEPIIPADGDEWVSRYMPKRNDRDLLRQFPNGIPADDIVHVMRCRPNSAFWGVGLIEAAAVAIDTGVATRVHNLAVHRNSGTPSMAITMEGTNQDNYAANRRLMDTQLIGPLNAGKALLLPGTGIKVEKMGFSARDLMLLETGNMSDEDVAAACGVPLQLVKNFPTKWDDLSIHRMIEFDARMAEHEDVIATENASILPEYLDPALWQLVPIYNDKQIRAIQAERMAKPFAELTAAGVPQQVAAKELGLDFGDGWDGWDRPIVASSRVDLADLSAGSVEENPDDGA